MKKVLLSLNLACALLGNLANAQDIDAVMRNAADRFNAQVPQRVDAITTISRVQYISDSKIFVYIYTIDSDVGYVKSQQAELQKMMTIQNCTSPGPKGMLAMGLTIKHRYYVGYTFATEVSVMRANCAKY
jgi:hypothetical protein